MCIFVVEFLYKEVTQHWNNNYNSCLFGVLLPKALTRKRKITWNNKKKK